MTPLPRLELHRSRCDDRNEGRGRGEGPTFRRNEKRGISVITVSELLYGVLRATGATRTRRRAFVEHVLAGLEAIPITDFERVPGLRVLAAPA